jgi:CDR ABC transporter
MLLQDDILVGDFDTNGVDQGRSMRVYIEEEFGYKHSFRWPALGILLVFVVGMRLTVAFTTKTLQWQKR